MKKQESLALAVVFALAARIACNDSSAALSSSPQQGISPERRLDPYVSQIGAITETRLDTSLGGGDASLDERQIYAILGDGYHIFVAGQTTGSLADTNPGSADLFIARFDHEGRFVWATQLGVNNAATIGGRGGDSSGSDVVSGVALDPEGNIVVSGYTDGSLGETNAGVTDVFVAKFDGNGNLLCITQVGAETSSLITGTGGGDASGFDASSGVAVDAKGYIYVAGFTAGSLGETSGGNTDTFVARFDSNCNLEWLTQVGAYTSAQIDSSTGGGDVSRLEVAQGVALDSRGNVLVGGYTDHDFGEARGGLDDAFALSMNPRGDLNWVRQLGSVTVGAAAGGDQQAFAIGVDANNSVVIAGDAWTSFGETTGGRHDIFAAKWNRDGTLAWIAQVGAVSAPGDASKDEHLTGRNTIDFDSQGGFVLGAITDGALAEPNGGSARPDAVIIRYLADGTLDWIRQYGADTAAFFGADASDRDLAANAAIDDQGNVYLAGDTWGDLGETNAGAPRPDVFVARVRPDGGLR